MKKEKIDRINELAHLAKERALTEEELAERASLRREYIEEFRRGTIELLEHLHSDPRRQKTPPAEKREDPAAVRAGQKA